MRVRTTNGGKSECSTHHYYYHTNDGGTHHEIGTILWQWSHGGGTIADVAERAYLTTKKGTRVEAMKPCTHEQWVAFCDQGTHDVYIDQGYAKAHLSGGSTMSVLYSVNNMDVGLKFLAKVLTAVNARAFNYGHYDRWQSTKPSLTTRANLAVFLYELRDIKRMFEVFPRRHFSCRDWKEVVYYFNNQHLNYNFGWKPFLKDIHHALEALKSLDSRIKAFVRGSNSDLTRHAASSPEDLSQVYEESFSNWWRVRYTIAGTIQRRSTFMYQYLVPNYRLDELRWRALLDSLGANLTVANVWRVIPFTFVIDWMVNISRFLDTFSEDWVTPELLFTQACWSMKAEASIDVTILNPPNRGESLPVGNMQYVGFRRGIGIPQFQCTDQSLNADKIRLLASLGASLILK
jgi:uncharacterized protein YlbG (UPF0298 family)